MNYALFYAGWFTEWIVPQMTAELSSRHALWNSDVLLREGYFCGSGEDILEMRWGNCVKFETVRWGHVIVLCGLPPPPPWIQHWQQPWMWCYAFHPDVLRRVSKWYILEFEIVFLKYIRDLKKHLMTIR